jgi:hypothetical protein
MLTLGTMVRAATTVSDLDREGNLVRLALRLHSTSAAIPELVV